MKRIALLVTLLFLTIFSFGQSNSIADTSLNGNSKSVNAASNRLLASIRDGKSHDEIGGNYFELALEISNTGDYVKAESYMNKAIAESNAGTGKSKATYYRELARIQEKQNKFTLASGSYLRAAELCTDSLQKKVNRNDAERVKQSSPQDQLLYLNQNAALLNTTSNKYDAANNLVMMANTNAAMNENPTAIQNFSDALTAIDTVNSQTISIQSNMVDLLVASNELPAAIKMQLDLVAETESRPDIETHIEQLKNLSALYIKADSVDAAITALQSAYEYSIEQCSYAGAKMSLLALASIYESQGQSERSDSLYRDFLNEADRLVQNDSTLFNRRQFEENEVRIAQLVQKQEFQDELMSRTNRYNYLLAISVVLLLLLSAVIGRTLLSIRKRNKQIALQSLRREMNPHFIFNSLNSVNQFIASNNELAANKYLTSYSNLMRNVMENSNKDYISLETEIEQLKTYLELERLRFPDKFDFKIVVDDSLNKDEMMIPNMVIQPNVENAIWHGLRYKESFGNVEVKFGKDNGRMSVVIEDNGIGMAESARMKTRNQKLHESLGLKNTQARIKLLNEIYKSDIRFSIVDKPSGGVIATISW